MINGRKRAGVARFLMVLGWFFGVGEGLLDHAEFFADFDEGGDGAVELLAVVAG